MSCWFVCCINYNVLLFTVHIEWEACHWIRLHNEKRIEIADYMAAKPLKLKLSAAGCSNLFKQYMQYMSHSSLNSLCQNFKISNLTSESLQHKFMYCTGLELYKHFSDSKGNVHVPSQFHNCKKMSFRDSGTPTLLISFPGSGNSWVRQLLESTTGIYTGSNRDCDVDYIKAGMLGEGISTGNVIAVKYHHGELPQLNFTKAIYIVRDPYDAIVAEFNRMYTKVYKFSDTPHTFEIGDKTFGESMCKSVSTLQRYIYIHTVIHILKH